MLGSDDITKWAKSCDIKLTNKVKKAIGNRPAIHLAEFASPQFSEYSSKSAIDLLSKMLTINPQRRWSAEQCLSHEYFKDNSI